MLRGINVGGKHMLPMKELVRMFEASGCADVRTYLQSGNVVFAASRAVAQRAARDVPEMVAAEFGFAPAVMVRTGEELGAVAAANPFAMEGVEAATLQVGFLESEPGEGRAGGIDPKRSPHDRYEVRGREIYLHFPRGVSQSKLTNAYLDSVLATRSTIRNWRTVMKLVEMAGAAG